MNTQNKKREYLDDFKNLFLEYYDMLCNFAYTYVRSKEVAEDIVQDVFFSLWSNKVNLDFTNPGPLLYKYTKNKSIDYLRRIQQRSISIDNDSVFPELDYYVKTLLINQEDDYHYKHLKTEIYRCIQELPVQNRKVFMLSRFSNLKNKEIAEKLGISIKTVEKHITSALVKIRLHLSEGGFIELLFLIHFCLY